MQEQGWRYEPNERGYEGSFWHGDELFEGDLAAYLTDLEAKVSRYEQALREYGWHRSSCQIAIEGLSSACTCGFDITLTGESRYCNQRIDNDIMGHYYCTRKAGHPGTCVGTALEPVTSESDSEEKVQ